MRERQNSRTGTPIFPDVLIEGVYCIWRNKGVSWQERNEMRDRKGEERPLMNEPEEYYYFFTFPFDSTLWILDSCSFTLAVIFSDWNTILPSPIYLVQEEKRNGKRKQVLFIHLYLLVSLLSDSLSPYACLLTLFIWIGKMHKKNPRVYNQRKKGEES